MFLSCLSMVRMFCLPWIMLLAAARLGPPRPRPRPVGGRGGGSLFFAKDWLASFHLVVNTLNQRDIRLQSEGERGRGVVPLGEEFAVRVDDFEDFFVGPEIEFEGNGPFGRRYDVYILFLRSTYPTREFLCIWHRGRKENQIDMVG